MITRQFQELTLSALGFGAMRLPVLDGNDSRIDKKETFRMVDEAMAKGINYYDTAWGYHGGNSETVIGEALAKYPRSSFFLYSFLCRNIFGLAGSVIFSTTCQ